MSEPLQSSLLVVMMGAFLVWGFQVLGIVPLVLQLFLSSFA